MQSTGNLVKAERVLLLNYLKYHQDVISKYQNKNGAIAKEFWEG